jgi:hypothetical protein
MAALAGCEVQIPTSRDQPTISQESFIATMVQLRVAAIRTPVGLATEEERNRILEEYGVSEDDLRTFADVHGTNVPMMEALWSEVERGIAEEFGVAPLTDEYPLGEPQETLP